ncbi:AIR synthase-related protein [Streptomyces sp. NPDC040750]|uniref:HypE family hydrogenase expression/formation protein n=1 Tax=Streptomyces sp. NPDC040750 TaxID=3154491 RepID=UPI0033EF8CD6
MAAKAALATAAGAGDQVALGDDPGLLFTAPTHPTPGPAAAAALDGVPPDGGGPVVVTRTFVCDPPFFGGADIARLAVCGAVNSLASQGAEPRLVTLGLTVEAGLSRRRLGELARSARDTAAEAGVVVAGVHGRVVRAGDADQVYVTATAVGTARRPPTGPAGSLPGDRVVVSGPLGDHEAHLLSLRAGSGHEHHVSSGCAPLADLVGAAFTAADGGVRAVTEVTEGGLAAVLDEVAVAAGVSVEIDEVALPVRRMTRLALDDLGVPAWAAASPGTLCLVVAPDAVPPVLAALRAHRRGRAAAVVGTVRREAETRLLTRTPGAPAPSRPVPAARLL